ncbi:MAG: FAD-binding oxidoreductase [Dehalococcoidales bacterium]
MWQFDTEVAEVVRRTPQIKSFRFPIRAKGVRYRSGQFFFITIMVDGREAIHHFSFSTSPTDAGYIEFTKRITGSDFSRALDRLATGDWARLRGPEGGFTLPRNPKRLAFLSGGIGITPLRSMLRYVVARQLAFDIVLVYGNNNVEDIAFRDELDELVAAQPGLRLEYVLSGEEVPADWTGKWGRITPEVIREVIPDYRERLFYVSGPPRMVVALETQLVELGVPPAQVKRDSFTGYD